MLGRLRMWGFLVRGVVEYRSWGDVKGLGFFFDRF